MKNGKVTILTPAYNGEKLIHRLLDSILSQTYPYVEMIIINDGSTDNTCHIINNYKTKFKEKGYKLTLITQKNQGLSATINNGLKLVDGDYLVWPDIDDWFSQPYSLEKMVNVLRDSSDEIGSVRCAMNLVDENTLQVDHIALVKPIGQHRLYRNSMTWQDGIYTNPGAWMIKTKFLDDFIPNRDIYVNKIAGQNAQILWPYLYYKDTITIEEPLFSYLVRKESHSRNMFKGADRKIQQQIDHVHTFIATINSIKDMPIDEKKELCNLQWSRIYSRITPLCYQYQDQKLYRKYYLLWKSHCHPYNISFKLKLLYYISIIPLSFKIIRYIKSL